MSTYLEFHKFVNYVDLNLIIGDSFHSQMYNIYW